MNTQHNIIAICHPECKNKANMAEKRNSQPKSNPTPKIGKTKYELAYEMKMTGKTNDEIAEKLEIKPGCVGTYVCMGKSKKQLEATT